MYTVNITLAIGGSFSWNLHSADKLKTFFDDAAAGELGRVAFDVIDPDGSRSSFQLAPTGENQFKVVPSAGKSSTPSS